MFDVELTMIDTNTNKTKTRIIDITNITIPNQCGTFGTPLQQERNLNNWITDRGNPQDETILQLVSWKLPNGDEHTAVETTKETAIFNA